MPDLADERCQPQAPGTLPLGADEVRALLGQLPGWQSANDKAISKEFRFKNYYETIGFVNAIAWMANRENHHPDLEVHYSRCLVRYSTHDVGGLSRNDFICAAKVDKLLAVPGGP